MQLPITAVTAAALALLLLALAIQTVRKRLQLQVAFGDGNDHGLTAAVRSHANLAEHAPIVLIMLALVEASDANTDVLMGVAGAFVVGRIAHVIGLHQKSEPGKAPIARQIGVILTWVTMVALVGMILLRVLPV